MLRDDNPASRRLVGRRSSGARDGAQSLLSVALGGFGARPSELPLANELDLARLWWRFGGGRSEAGKFERLKLLRDLGERLIRRPGLAAFAADELKSKTVEELLHVETLREDRAGATRRLLARHAYAIGRSVFCWMKGRICEPTLPADRPLPGALARGLEIAARLALQSDSTGARWLALLAAVRARWVPRQLAPACPHGLAAIGERARIIRARLKPALVADKGRRLKEIIQLMLAVETVPCRANSCSRSTARADLGMRYAARMVVPTGSDLDAGRRMGCASLSDRLAERPHSRSRESLSVCGWSRSQSQTPGHQSAVVQRLYEWLTRIEDAKRPIAITDPREARELDLNFEHLHQVHEDIRMTFLSFCHLNPAIGERYLAETEPELAPRRARYPEIFRERPPRRRPPRWPISRSRLDPGGGRGQSLIGARRDRFGPFGIFDSDLCRCRRARVRFSRFLKNRAQDGLRLVRGIVEYATQWQFAKATRRKAGHFRP